MSESPDTPRLTVRVTVTHVNRNTDKDTETVAENVQRELNRPDTVVTDVRIEPDNEESTVHLDLPADLDEKDGNELKLLIMNARGLLSEVQYAKSVLLKDWGISITTGT